MCVCVCVCVFRFLSLNPKLSRRELSLAHLGEPSRSRGRSRSTALPGIRRPPGPLAGSEGITVGWQYIPNGFFRYSSDETPALPWRGRCRLILTARICACKSTCPWCLPPGHVSWHKPRHEDLLIFLFLRLFSPLDVALSRANHANEIASSMR